jgi:hypothetical protein
MTTSYQRNALDISYNGWENYETWNVALWINNDIGYHHLAVEAGNYEDFVEPMHVVSTIMYTLTVFVMMTLK